MWTPRFPRTLRLALGAAALGVMCAAVAGLWTWQDRRHSGVLDFRGYHLAPAGVTEYLRGLSGLIEGQTVLDGAPQLGFFTSLLFDAEERGGRRLTRLEARPLVPEDTWFDLVARKTDDGHVAFRLSRCLDVPSGWYVFRGPVCVAHEEVDTSSAAPPGPGPEPRRRANLKAFTVWHLNRTWPLVDEEFHTRPVDLVLTMDGASLEIAVNGERLSTFSLAGLATPELWAQGAAGVRGSDLPPVRLDRMGLVGVEADGTPFQVEATFDLPPMTVGQWLGLTGRHFAWLVAAAVALWGALVFLLPGARVSGLTAGLTGGFGLMALLTLWAEWKHLIAFAAVIDWWRAGAWTLLGLVAVLLVIRNRRHFRYRAARHPPRDFPGTSPAPEAASLGDNLVLFLFFLGLAALWVWSWRGLTEPPTVSGTELSLPAGTPAEWSPDRPLHLPIVPPGQAVLGLKSQWRVTLGDASAELEFYFQRRDQPPAALPLWEALRLAPAGMARVSSVGFEPALAPPALPVGVPMTLGIEMSDGWLIASIASAEGGQSTPARVRRFPLREPWRNAGAVGIVGRAGSGSVQPLGGEVTSLPRADIEAWTLRAAGRLHRQRFLLAAISLPMLIALGLGFLTWCVGRAERSAALSWGAIAGLSGAGLAVLLAGLEMGGRLQTPPHDWPAAVVFWAPALLATALWYLFWVCNFTALRAHHIVSLALLAALLLEDEMLARQLPQRWKWQPRTLPGYVQREFLFADDSASLIWGAYTGEVRYRSRLCPIVPAAPERRVFCLGGSSTWGAGVNTAEETYPALLEAELRRRSGDPTWQVYNAGLPSFTVLDDLLRWRRDVRARHPEVIVLYVGGNDHIATDRAPAPQLEMWRLVQALNEPTLRSRLSVRLMDLRLLAWADSVWRGLWGGQLSRYTTRLPPEDFERVLRQLLTEARADGVRVVLAPEVIVECLTQPGHSLLPWHRVLAQVAREFGATLAPTVETFRAHRLDDLMIDYIHPNAHGNQILAEAIATAVLAASSPEIHARAPVDSPRLTAQSPASL